MKIYKNINTGFFWTEEEVREQYEKQAHEEGLRSFDEMMEDLEEVTLEWFMEESNNGILTDGMYFYVDLGNDEGSGILIEKTEYAKFLSGSEAEFQEGIADIDEDTGLWQELFDRYLREKEESGYL